MDRDEQFQMWFRRLSRQEQKYVMARLQMLVAEALPGVDLEWTGEPWVIPPIVEQIVQAYCDTVASELLADLDLTFE
jgi:hypothetical protein